MFTNFNLYIVTFCIFLITTSVVVAQSTQDSTNLPKMQESDFKAMDTASPLTVLTKGNLKETFLGLQVTRDNNEEYWRYYEDLRYRVVEHAGSLAIQRYTPKMDCLSHLYGDGRTLCLSDDKKLGGRTTIVCSFAQDAKSCMHANGSFYELTVDGLLMGESYATCWMEHVPMINMVTKCGYKQHSRKVYVWDTP